MLANADADMKKLTKNLVDAFPAVIKNLVPVIENMVAALPTASTRRKPCRRKKPLASFGI